MPPRVCGAQRIGQLLAAWTLLGVSGAAYGWGLSALWLFPATASSFGLSGYTSIAIGVAVIVLYTLLGGF